VCIKNKKHLIIFQKTLMFIKIWWRPENWQCEAKKS
jgi:hypothetical protein